jgi:hypothetical protein
VLARRVLRPRRDLAARPFRRFGTVDGSQNTIDSLDVRFRGSITRPTGSLCTLRRTGSPPRHATLGTGWWPTCAGQLSLLGPSRRFQLGLHPPSPGFAWRTSSSAPAARRGRSVASTRCAGCRWSATAPGRGSSSTVRCCTSAPSAAPSASSRLPSSTWRRFASTCTDVQRVQCEPQPDAVDAPQVH